MSIRYLLPLFVFVSMIKCGNCVRHFAAVSPTELWRISSSVYHHDDLPDE